MRCRVGRWSFRYALEPLYRQFPDPQNHRPYQDERFLQFLQKVGKETLELFGTADFLLLDAVHREQLIPERLKPRINNLVSLGIIERFGRGRGIRYILSHRFYALAGKKGVYTRRKGLDRETNKALLLKHITENNKHGSGLKELMQVLPALSKDQIQTLMKELKAEGRIHNIGKTRSALWMPGLPEQQD